MCKNAILQGDDGEAFYLDVRPGDRHHELYDPVAIGETCDAVRAELLTYIYALGNMTMQAGTIKITLLMMDPATMVRAFLIGKLSGRTLL